MLQGTKGCILKYKQAMATMDYSFLALQCIQGVPYIVLQRDNGGSNMSDLEAYGRPRDKWFRHTSRKNPKIFVLSPKKYTVILGDRMG